MTDDERETLSAFAAGFGDPNTGRSLGEADAVRELKLDERSLHVTLALRYAADRAGLELAGSLREALAERTGGRAVDVDVEWEVRPQAVQASLKPLPGIRNVVAVASGKGGVGKSTVAVNLALALAREGARVGILDADIYGPSQPRMLGLGGQHPVSRDGKNIEPMSAHGIFAMSIGFLIDEEQPMVWRGPMVTQALNQLLGQTSWGELDYLLVDMPPGTGDIQLTLAQRVPVSGAIIVTTPQDIALLDARKGLKMFQKVNVPVLGIVENMSTHVCSRCGHEEHIFGEAGGRRLAEQYGVPLLGALPLDVRIREQADGGCPTVAAEPDSPLARGYVEAARRAAGELSGLARDYSHKFPDIVVEDS